MNGAGDRPRVSVVVATCNGARFLGATLDSVLAQTWPDVELLVCDDGSRDETPDVLATYADRAVLLRQDNRGVSAARNAAAARASGDLLAFLDHDDLHEPDMLARQVACLQRHPGAGLVYGDSWIIDEQGRQRGRRREFLDYREGPVHTALLGGNFIPIETALLPAAVFRQLGGFDEQLHYLEDHDLYLRLSRRWPVAFNPGLPVARYRVHDSNLSHRHEELLTEWCAVLQALLDDDDQRPAAERALVERELARRAGEVGWAALRRGDLEAAARWTTRAGRQCPAPLQRRLHLATTLLEALPRPLSRALLARLPRRRFYGV